MFKREISSTSSKIKHLAAHRQNWIIFSEVGVKFGASKHTSERLKLRLNLQTGCKPSDMRQDNVQL